MAKMWATLVHLTMNMWGNKDNEMYWDEESWEVLIDECVRYGINTLVLDIGDGLRYQSHPEIAVDGAWSPEKMGEKLEKCRALGITVIPKLNFSAAHDQWMGEYHRMLSTSAYYKVCRDLIGEVAELFGHPRYIHLGMDEEDYSHAVTEELVIYRRDELLFRDLRFLCDCVKETGATPWIWHDPLFFNQERFRKYISPDEILLSPWHYYAFREEHLTPITKYDFIYEYYSKGEYAAMNLKYVEEDPFFVNFRQQAIPNAEYGYKYVPCASTIFKCEWNHQDLVEYFRDNAPAGCVQGYMTAPWCVPREEKLEAYRESFRSLAEARGMFCPEESV